MDSKESYSSYVVVEQNEIGESPLHTACLVDNIEGF